MHGLTKHLACGLAACVPVAGLLMAFGPAAGASTAGVPHRVHYTAVELAKAKSELKQLLIGQHGTDKWYGDSRPSASNAGLKPAAQTKVQSTNWSGYADTGTGFTKVTSTWTEPTATCGSGTSLAAFWVGIDGFSSQSVEQDGTIIECSGGQAVYFDWWEMFPANAVQVVNTVQPGDSITATVTRSGTSYKLAVTDSTTPADSFSTTQTCSGSTCANSSAEWIAEAPSGSSGVEPLSNFGVWKTKNAKVSTSAKSGVIHSFAYDQITMVDSSGTVESQPSGTNPAGNWFKATWKAST